MAELLAAGRVLQVSIVIPEEVLLSRKSAQQIVGEMWPGYRETVARAITEERAKLELQVPR